MRTAFGSSTGRGFSRGPRCRIGFRSPSSAPAGPESLSRILLLVERPPYSALLRAIDRAARSDLLKRFDPGAIGAAASPRARYATYTALWAAVFIGSQVFVVNPKQVRAMNFTELIPEIKADPTKFSFGFPGSQGWSDCRMHNGNPERYFVRPIAF